MRRMRNFSSRIEWRPAMDRPQLLDFRYELPDVPGPAARQGLEKEQALAYA